MCVIKYYAGKVYQNQYLQTHLLNVHMMYCNTNTFYSICKYLKTFTKIRNMFGAYFESIYCPNRFGENSERNFLSIDTSLVLFKLYTLKFENIFSINQ